MIRFRNGTSPLWRRSSARLEGGALLMVFLPYRIYLKWIKQCWTMSTCTWLDLESLGSWPTMPKNFVGTGCVALWIRRRGLAYWQPGGLPGMKPEIHYRARRKGEPKSFVACQGSPSITTNSSTPITVFCATCAISITYLILRHMLGYTNDHQQRNQWCHFMTLGIQSTH